MEACPPTTVYLLLKSLKKAITAGNDQVRKMIERDLESLYVSMLTTNSGTVCNPPSDKVASSDVAVGPAVVVGAVAEVAYPAGADDANAHAVAPPVDNAVAVAEGAPVANEGAVAEGAPVANDGAVAEGAPVANEVVAPVVPVAGAVVPPVDGQVVVRLPNGYVVTCNTCVIRADGSIACA
jgi:hypothetical protein